MGRYPYIGVAAIEARGRRAPDAVRDRFGAERETILRAQRYEVEAIEALFDDHFDGLYRFCVSLVGEAGAEELARRTWDRALEGLPRFRRFESGFGTWLERIALSLVNSVAPPVGGGAEDRLRIALRRSPATSSRWSGCGWSRGFPRPRSLAPPGAAGCAWRRWPFAACRR